MRVGKGEKREVGGKTRESGARRKKRGRGGRRLGGRAEPQALTQGSFRGPLVLTPLALYGLKTLFPRGPS